MTVMRPTGTVPDHGSIAIDMPTDVRTKWRAQRNQRQTVGQRGPTKKAEHVRFQPDTDFACRGAAPTGRVSRAESGAERRPMAIHATTYTTHARRSVRDVSHSPPRQLFWWLMLSAITAAMYQTEITAWGAALKFTSASSETVQWITDGLGHRRCRASAKYGAASRCQRRTLAPAPLLTREFRLRGAER
jgi:hypothetical protein